MPGTSRRSIIGLTATLATVALTAGCGGSSEEASEPSADGALETQSITIGYLPIPGYAPLHVAQEEGFYEDEGLDVTLETMAPGSSVPSIVGGSLDFAGQNWLAIGLAINQGVELQPVAELERGTPEYAEFLVPADSPITSLEDLDGAKVGVVNTPGNCDLIAQAVLRSQDSEVTPEYVNLAVPDMAGTLQRGGVAAACVPEPTLSAMKASGDFRSVFDLFSDDYEDFPVSGVFTSQEFAEANPNTVDAVQRALERANALIQEDEQVVRQAVPQFTSVPAEAADAMVLPTFPETDFSSLSAVVDLLDESGLASGVEFPATDE